MCQTLIPDPDYHSKSDARIQNKYLCKIYLHYFRFIFTKQKYVIFPELKDLFLQLIADKINMNKKHNENAGKNKKVTDI